MDVFLNDHPGGINDSQPVAFPGFYCSSKPALIIHLSLALYQEEEKGRNRQVVQIER